MAFISLLSCIFDLTIIESLFKSCSRNMHPLTCHSDTDDSPWSEITLLFQDVIKNLTKFKADGKWC